MGRQLTFDQCDTGRRHGGKRKGAGRKSQRRDGRSCDPKRRRDRFCGRRAMHVTLRVQRGVASLRNGQLIHRIRAGFLAIKQSRKDFAVIHYSIQSNHIHLIVEANDNEALGRGMKAVGIRIAKAVNKVFERTGKVLETGYHAQSLRKDRQIHNALRYVLLNTRKHTGGRGLPQIDPFSSMRWYEGFSGPELPADRDCEPEVSTPCIRALERTWQYLGRIHPSEIPGQA